MSDNDLDRSRRSIEELKARVEAELAETRRQGDEQRRLVNNELDDPLFKGPIGRVNDLEFDGHGRLKQIRQISMWRDGNGNEFYTPTGRLPLDQVRVIRDKVVGQQTIFGTLSEDERARVEAEHSQSTEQSAVSRPFGEYLRSRQLGERFSQLKKNPPRPSANR